jgi:hypothetical protein
MRLYKVRETVLDSGVFGSNDSGKAWCDLSALDFEAACLVSPFIESTGSLAVELDGRYGGWSECIAAGPFELRERFAAMLSPVHRRYRWYPPRGSTVLDGRSIASAFLAGIDEIGLEGQDAAALSAECGFTDNVIQNKGVRRHIALELPDGRRYLMFIGVPHRGDGREERIPWLHKVTDRDFANVEAGHRSEVERCWNTAWSSRRVLDLDQADDADDRDYPGFRARRTRTRADGH